MLAQKANETLPSMRVNCSRGAHWSEPVAHGGRDRGQRTMALGWIRRAVEQVRRPVWPRGAAEMNCNENTKTGGWTPKTPHRKQMRIAILFSEDSGVSRLAPRRSRGRGERVFGVFGIECQNMRAIRLKWQMAFVRVKVQFRNGLEPCVTRQAGGGFRSCRNGGSDSWRGEEVEPQRRGDAEGGGQQ